MGGGFDTIHSVECFACYAIKDTVLTVLDLAQHDAMLLVIVLLPSHFNVVLLRILRIR